MVARSKSTCIPINLFFAGITLFLFFQELPVPCFQNASSLAASTEREQALLTESSIVPAVPGTDGEVRQGTAGKTALDGLSIITMVSERGRGKDYRMTVACIFTEKGRVRHRMKYREKRINCGGKGRFLYKAVLRYTSPPNIQGRSFLIWKYKDRGQIVWYYEIKMTKAQQITNVAYHNLKSSAESDFDLMDYVEIDPGEEKHRVLGSEKEGGITYYLVESIPIKKIRPYGKRISRIDINNLIAVQVDYFDKKGKPWKTLSITWQNIEGIWLWKKAVVKNVQTKFQTFIIVEDATVNAGLKDREFTTGSLEQQNF